MNDAAAANQSAAKHITTRIAAIRADIRAVQASTVRGREAMLKALAKDLREQEFRLADAIAPKCRHDFSDGDVCSKCDALRGAR